MIDKIKRLMYDPRISHDTGFEINDIIYEYDKQRSKNENERMNAGKEWEYRLKKFCDYRVTLE